MTGAEPWNYNCEEIRRWFGGLTWQRFYFNCHPCRKTSEKFVFSLKHWLFYVKAKQQYTVFCGLFFWNVKPDPVLLDNDEQCRNTLLPSFAIPLSTSFKQVTSNWRADEVNPTLHHFTFPFLILHFLCGSGVWYGNYRSMNICPASAAITPHFN